MELAGLDDVLGWVEDFYRHLHQHPELSHQEVDTAAAVARRLRELGYDVHEGVGGTGVIGVLERGTAGAAVLLRADMDALPVREATGLPYASTVTARDPDGDEVPVMHACGHDVHVACLLGAADLLAHRDDWHGRLVLAFQPAEETGDGAAGMVDDGFADLVGRVDVALVQHVLPFPSGVVGTRAGAVLSTADSMRVTVHGRGAHGSMPQASVDPVLLAAMIVVRLQGIVSREIAPTDPAVLTVGSIRSGTKSNVIGDHAVLELNVRTYDEATRTTVLDAVERVVRAECQASGSPEEPTFELYDRFPSTTNDEQVTGRVRAAFDDHFGDASTELPLQTASEDFSDLPRALGVPYTYWGLGGIDPETYRTAAAAGRVAQDIPVNHSATFAPALEPTLTTGVQALTVAALAWLGEDGEG